MKNFKWFSTAVTIAVFILASLTTACTPSAPSPVPPTETPSTTDSPQQGQPTEEEAIKESTVTPSPTPIPTTKRALFVIYRDFEESEYSDTRTILEDAGVIVIVASKSLNIVTGHISMRVKPDIALNEVNGADYDVIVFVGGYGYVVDDPEASRIAQEGAAAGKVLAAICIAPITLANAGLLNGKRVTSNGIYDSTLTSKGAILACDDVVRDGLIITANGPWASQTFGETIAAALEE